MNARNRNREFEFVNFMFRYAFALVVFRVASRHALLNDLFLGMLYKSCTYCVPMYLARNKYADESAYKEALGFAKTENADKTLVRIRELHSTISVTLAQHS
jgi:hypothetical protein